MLEGVFEQGVVTTQVTEGPLNMATFVSQFSVLCRWICGGSSNSSIALWVWIHRS